LVLVLWLTLRRAWASARRALWQAASEQQECRSALRRSISKGLPQALHLRVFGIV